MLFGAAITYYHLTKHLRSSKVMWNLSDNEIQELNLRWCQKVVNGGELLAQEFVKGCE